MLAALFGGYEFFYLIGKKYHTYLIVVLYSRECNSCSDFGHHLTFGLSYRSKISTGRDIDQKHDCQFPFFFKYFHVRFIVTCRHVPVYISYVIAILIFSDLGERHTPTFKSRMVLPRKYITGKPSRLYLDMTNFFQQLTGFHKLYPEHRLGNFYLVEYFTNNFFCGHIVGLGFVAQPDTMTQYIVTNGSHIFGNNIAPLF